MTPEHRAAIDRMLRFLDTRQDAEAVRLAEALRATLAELDDARTEYQQRLRERDNARLRLHEIACVLGVNDEIALDAVRRLTAERDEARAALQTSAEVGMRALERAARERDEVITARDFLEAELSRRIAEQRGERMDHELEMARLRSMREARFGLPTGPEARGATAEGTRPTISFGDKTFPVSDVKVSIDGQECTPASDEDVAIDAEGNETRHPAGTAPWRFKNIPGLPPGVETRLATDAEQREALERDTPAFLARHGLKPEDVETVSLPDPSEPRFISPGILAILGRVADNETVLRMHAILGDPESWPEHCHLAGRVISESQADENARCAFCGATLTAEEGQTWLHPGRGKAEG